MAKQQRFDVLERVRELLPEVLARPDQPPSDHRRRAVAIGLSVLVAFVLWFTFSMRESYSLVVEMPLALQGLPEGRALARPPPRLARVTVQGEGWELLKLRRSPPVLDVRAPEPRVDLFAAASESNRLPPGVAVQSVAPNTLELDLEPRIVRTIPIRPRTRIQAAPLYDLLAGPVVAPDTVRVAGARSIINTLDYWPTELVEREGVQGTFTATVTLSDTLSGLVQKSVQQVRLTARAELFTEATRELEVRVQGAPPGSNPVRLIPQRLEVTYRIPVDQYERSLVTDDFYAFVPYPTIVNDTTGTVQPILHLPEELHVRDVRATPRRLRYRVRIE